MIEIRQTEVYSQWFGSLRDQQARARIDARIRRLSLGNPGDVKPVAVGEGVSELRINYGPGYRVYFVQRGQTLVVLLAGGDKHNQDQESRRRWNWRENYRRLSWQRLKPTLGRCGTSGNRGGHGCLSRSCTRSG